MSSDAVHSRLDDDLFDSILLADDEFRGKGYREGFIEGGQLGETEGQRYGLANGAKIGSEVSFYRGFAITWKCLLQNNEDVKKGKKLKALNSILEMAHSFPYEDPTNEGLQGDLEKMRAKFKQICSLLNVQPKFYNEKTAGMSF
ncbi:protein LTO1 homolog isoform X1 [Hypanus sabinus]|uniref:protein LTO1 homolog isoform X1 n=1 Tax=Hypanus sabinus TaxID=79690 RepID=UPI0028C4E73A|nr:protein LTO1 homolog isoform X1 [Hypanus sabinus]